MSVPLCKTCGGKTRTTKRYSCHTLGDKFLGYETSCWNIAGCDEARSMSTKGIGTTRADAMKDYKDQA